ncbi:MAG: DNA polymerase Y family protein [Acetobacterales bacterium]
MRRVISLWLPTFPTDRLRRSGAPAELVTVAPGHGGPRVIAATVEAAAASIMPGLGLPHARALLPGLAVRPADPAGDARALAALAERCLRYTPWTAAERLPEDTAAPPGAGIWLDVTGCAHLFVAGNDDDGEHALVEDLQRHVAALGYDVRAALADTPGAAWGAARYATSAEAPCLVVPPGGIERRLPGLPVAALRLPEEAVADLDRLGLRRIADLKDIARAPLARRLGSVVRRQLDRFLGAEAEPISPHLPAKPYVEGVRFAEPIAHLDPVRRAAVRLLYRLCARLERDGRGARRLVLAFHLCDGGHAEATAGTGRAVRDPAHLLHLLAPQFEGLDLGFGADAVTLHAPRTDPLAPRQTVHAAAGGPPQDDEALAQLLDRLAGRLGARRIHRLAPFESHIPERAMRAAPPLGRLDWPRPSRLRPLRLLPWPEPVEATAAIPDGPPVLLRWRRQAHRVRRANGPERLAPEWWCDAPSGRDAARVRDYYRVELADGRRLWLFREGLYGAGGDDRPPRWFVHGSFA